MKKYGQVIAKLRKKQGLTQEQLGKKLNVSYQAVSKWENNLSQPDLETIEKLSDIFEISISEFFDMAKNLETKQIDSPNINQTPEQQIQNSTKTAGGFAKFVKTNRWYLVAGLSILIVILTLCAILIPVKYSSAKIFNSYDSAVFYLTAQNSSTTKSGTGFFINNSGLAVTVYSNIKNCTSGTVQLNDGKQYDIEKIFGVDEENNLAIIQIDIDRTNSVILGNSNNINLSDKVYAITYTTNDKLDDANSIITEGIIFKVESDTNGTTSIQTTASVDDANKGGVLFNEYGKVIGIVSGSLNISGVGFDMVNVCVPSNKISAVKKQYNYTLQEYLDKFFEFEYISNETVYKSVSIFESDKVENIQPTKNGYTFDGWYTDETYLTLFDFSQEITSATKCYAKWTPHNCILTYAQDANSAITQTQTLVYDQTYNLLDIVYQKEGYVHSGWVSTDGSLTFDLLQSVKNLTAEHNRTINLIARFEPITYTIKFNGNGDTAGYMSNQTFTYDQSKSLYANEFTKQGYIFNGWSYNDQTFTDEQQMLNLTAEDDAILEFVAIWKPIEYTFVFENVDEVIGTEDEIQPIKFTYDESQTLDLKTVCFPKQVIESWKCSSCTDTSVATFTIKNGTTILNKTIINDTVFTFTPVYSASKYYVRYNANGGTGTMSDMQLVTYGTTAYTYSCNFKKAGYHFVGWTDNVCSSVHTAISAFSNHSETHLDIVDFYANWEINYYYISTYYDFEETTIATLEYNQSFTLPECTYTKEGYVFSHWKYQLWDQIDYEYDTYTLEDCATVVNLGKIETTFRYTIKLEPVWTPIEYYVQFDSNGGVGQMQTITATYDKSVDFENMFTKVNHTLLYWTCGDRIISGDSIPARLTTVAGQTLTFMANWIESFTGAGTEQSPYQISSIEDFNKISQFLKYKYSDYTNQYYELTCNIDATDKTIVSPYSFYGYFNGNNYTISNISNCTGLFDIFCGEIRNLHLKNFTLETSDATLIGPFATDAGSPVLENCSVTGSITYTGTGGLTIGGLIGNIYNNRGTITNCYSNLTINVQDLTTDSTDNSNIEYKIGGLVGYAYHYGLSIPTDEILTIQNCYAVTNVNITKSTAVNSLYFAGIIRTDKANISNCFAMYNVNANVTATNYIFGLFVTVATSNYIKCTNCYVVDGSKIMLNNQQVSDFVNIVPWVAGSEIISANWLVETLLFDETIWLIQDGELPVLKTNDN